MKKIYLFLLLSLASFVSAQNGADIKGLVKISGIQQSNTNKVLLTDGNGNLGYTTLSNLANVGTVVTTTLNTAVVKTQVAKPAIFRNLPDFNTNRIATLDTNGSIGYRILNSSGNATAISGTVGLQASNLINLGTGIFSAPTNYAYIVTVDNNGVLGKMPLNTITTTPSNLCGTWITTGASGWTWSGCTGSQTVYQQRTCYYLDGTPYTAYQSVSQTRTDGCTQNPGVACYWTTTSYGPWICDPANINGKRRIKNESLICTNYNGTTFTSATQSVNYDTSGTNQAPIADFTWTANYRTISFDASPSYDPDGSIVSYKWEYGDASTQTFAANTASHNYNNSNPASPVSSWVKLTITDNCGLTSTVTKYVTTTYIAKAMTVETTLDFVRYEWYYGNGTKDAVASLDSWVTGNDISISLTNDLLGYNSWDGPDNGDNAYIHSKLNLQYTIDGITNSGISNYTYAQDSPSVGNTWANNPNFSTYWTSPYIIISLNGSKDYLQFNEIYRYGTSSWIAALDASGNFQANEIGSFPKIINGAKYTNIRARSNITGGDAHAIGFFKQIKYLTIKYF